MTLTLWCRNIVSTAAFAGFVVAPAAVLARDADPTSETIATMGAGDFLWNDSHGAQAATDAVRIVVSVPDQKLYVYRGVRLVAVSAVSTGKAGHDTPTGDFRILQKQVIHKSNLYDSAPMPYMQRITWDGVAIHAGRDPGYAASHGCVRVPIGFAKRLFAITRLGARVTITDEPVADLMPAEESAPADRVAPEVTPTAEVPAPAPAAIAYQPEQRR